ncbi:uncharacterized protein MONBRDRAFT_28495 [Monosiga brevicollis MX1]|uniref:Hemerythrin-like domain-containing protein n=1 Tax=Monosiga brevicollis TaxID=81824 RepID=A9V8B9_MONBE|nr:uncharacterized protein MONBRDRAFT_28495 [Monosiga brevicollis MX1]EDQ86244.1 predicted protein [Monosiga brevicollis MX1]|eukprot:XP_001748914.1 hypothetical protein [Monosiga brevicollis MX1]
MGCLPSKHQAQAADKAAELQPTTPDQKDEATPAPAAAPAAPADTTPAPAAAPAAPADTTPAPAAAPAAPADTTPAPAAEKPRPMIFALMRNGHEVIRGGVEDCRAALEANDKDLFYKSWNELMEFYKMHAAMEDGYNGVCKGMFAMLNEQFPNVADDLPKLHEELHGAEHAVQGAVDKGAELEELRALFTPWAENNEAHLKQEEGVMMPCVSKLAASGFNLRQAMREHLLPAAVKMNIDHFVGYAMRVLEAHPGNMPRARVFAHALQFSATEEQWKAWHPIVKANLSPALYASICEEVGWEPVSTRVDMV